MTPADLQTEREHEYQTRLGMMCGAGEPTREQMDQTARIADEHVSAIEREVT
jgi:hypothetical protein